jgi:uncharacterized protein YuzE
VAVTIAGLEFEEVSYDLEADVLTIQRSGAESTVATGESREGDEIRFGADGGIVGMTIRRARERYLPQHRLTITLSKHRVIAKPEAFGEVFTAQDV